MLDNLPGVSLVFDKFHVVRLMNEKLTEIRRRLHSELEDGLAKQVLKGSRWILVKNPEKLREKYKEKDRLEEALRFNEPLPRAYCLASDMGTVEQGGRGRISRRLDRADHGFWCRAADDHGQDDGSLSIRDFGLVRPPHHIGQDGGNQQQDQDDETPSIGLSRPGVLQSPHTGHSRSEVRSNRMSL